MVVVILHLQKKPSRADSVLSVQALISLWLMESDRKMIWRRSLIQMYIIGVEPRKALLCTELGTGLAPYLSIPRENQLCTFTWCSGFPKGKHMNERQKVPSHLTGVLACSHCCFSEESLFSHPLLRKPRKIYRKAQLPALGVAKFAFPKAGKLWETMPKPCHRLFSLWMLMHRVTSFAITYMLQASHTFTRWFH